MKKISFSFTVAFIVLLFCSCSNISDGADPVPAPMRDDSFDYTVNQEHLITQVGKSYGAGEYIAANDGMYEFIFSEKGTNLTYTDYVTQKHVFLCNRPECRHDDEACTSFFSTENGLKGLLYAAEKVILVTPIGGDTYPANLEVIDKDGTNRRTLMELKDNQSMMPPFFSNNNSLFFCVQTTHQNGDVLSELVQVNLDTGETVVLRELGDQGCSIYGSIGDKLLLNFHNAYEIMEAENGIPEGVDVHNEMILYNPLTRTESNIIYERYSTQATSITFDGLLYEYNFSLKEFKRYDLLTGEITTIANNSEYQDADNLYLIDCIDGKLLADASYQKDVEDHSYRLVVDFEKDSIYECTLRNEGVKPGPPLIKGEYKDSLILLTGYREIPYVTTDTDGNAVDSVLYIPQHAMISKADYFNSKPSYSYIDPIKVS